ncbi:MAG: alpha/beta fold hydrolase, partial [Pseudomonadota bacterium]
MNLFSKALVASAITLCAPLSAQAGSSSGDTAEDAAARFGVRSSVLDISLSPSGNKIAWVAPGPEHTEVLKIYDMNAADGVQTIISNSEKTGDLSRCDWVTETRLICQIVGMAKRSDGLLLPYDRIFAINADGSEAQQISERRSRLARSFNQDGGDVVALDVAGDDGQILVTRNYVEEGAIGTRLGSSKEGLGVDRVDIDNGRRRSVESPDDLASRYIADETGELRFKVRSLVDGNGVLTGQRVYMYREPGKRNWSELSDITLDGKPIGGFSPIAVSAANNSLYAYKTIGGYDAVIEIRLDGSSTASLVVSRDDVDVDGLIRIGRQRRVVGAIFATEKRSVRYFDKELADLASALSKALPNQPLVSIAGASADENRLIIIASSDTDPGTVYLYDKSARQLEQLLAMREFLTDRAMGSMTPISYPAADGTEIPGYLTLPAGSDGKNLPAIVLPHGGPAARDYWGFDWIVQFFTARGYAVLQPNYRGSSGYGAAWYGRNGFKAWDVAIGDVNDAGRWLVSEGIADPGKLAIAGWSYGGYAALQSQVVAPDLYKAVVAIAPVTDLGFLREDARGYTNVRLVRDYIGRGPHIEAGSPRRHAEKFSAPVALFHGTLDINVEVRHSRA